MRKGRHDPDVRETPSSLGDLPLLHGSTKLEASSHLAQGRWELLDLLRFAAASAVLVYHYSPKLASIGYPLPTPISAAANFGYLGVELFFIISGAVIVLSAASRTARAFLVNRIIRLYPTFWAALFLAIVAHVALKPGYQLDPMQILANLTMLPGYLRERAIDDVYWTLGVEWKFYVLIAILLTVGAAQYSEQLARMWVALIAMQHLLPSIGWLESLIVFPYGSHFAFGVLLLAIRQHGATRVRFAWALAAILVCGATTAKVHAEFVPQSSTVTQLIAVGISTSFCLFLLLFARRRLPIAYAARAQLIGSSTYPLYLLHAGAFYPVLQSLAAALPPAWAALITLGLLVGTVYLFSRYLERGLVPYLAKARLTKRLAGPPPPN